MGTFADTVNVDYCYHLTTKEKKLLLSVYHLQKTNRCLPFPFSMCTVYIHRCCNKTERYTTVRYKTVRYITVRYKMVRYKTVCYKTNVVKNGTRYRTVRLQNGNRHKTVHITKRYVTERYVLQNGT
jgi:hypothetical protein